LALALWRLGGVRGQAAEGAALEDENKKLKKLLAESMLDVATLKEMLGKNF
jgi:putative transposase